MFGGWRRRRAEKVIQQANVSDAEVLEDASEESEEQAMVAMPKVWAGRRRVLLVLLAVLGVLQAVLAVIMALTVSTMLTPEAATDRWDFVALFGSVLGIGLARWMEAVWAEDLGQDYVFEQRHKLVTAAIGDAEYNSSLGVTVTRTSNDLGALRNWVAQGIVPLVTGIPLIVVVVVSLFFADWHIGVAVAIPLLLILLVMPPLARWNLRRSREVRKRRGRLSARIADTVMAGESVRVSGAVARELKAVDRDSGKVVNASIDRAWAAGLTRSLSATAASLTTVGVVVLSVTGSVSTADVASTMTLLGVLATPVSDLGRVVEYRQDYRAASLILAPLLDRAEVLRGEERRRRRHWKREHSGEMATEPSLPQGVAVRGLVLAGWSVPDISARPGERVHLVAQDPHYLRTMFSSLSGAHRPGVLTIDGNDFAQAPDRIRRELVGMASEHVPLERGSVKRLVSFRVPSASDAEVREKLRKVGLSEKVHDDERGWNRVLKMDGRPWSHSEAMLLKIARAMLEHPPMLVLEGVDNALDEEAAARIKALLADYEGVIMFSSPRPERLFAEYREWAIDGDPFQIQKDRLP